MTCRAAHRVPGVALAALLSGSLAILPGITAAATAAAAERPAVETEALPPLPLTGAAYRIADAAYQAYARRDYAAAIANAKEAIRLRPDVARLKTLLQQSEYAAQRAAAGKSPDTAVSGSPAVSRRRRSTSAKPPGMPATAAAASNPAPNAARDPARDLATQGFTAIREERLTDALALFEQVLAIAPGDHEMIAQRDNVRRLLARAPAAAAYKAMGENDAVTGQREIAKAIEFAPDVAAYRLLLIDALERQGLYAQAEAAATAAMALDDEDVVPVVLRGYLRQKQRNHAGAREDYATALKNDTLSEDDARSLRLFVSDAALSDGDDAAAVATLAPLPATDADAVWRRKLIKSANGLARPPLQAPVLDCRLTPYGTVCTVRPAEAASNEMAQAVYRALAKKDTATAVTLARELATAQPANDNYQRILVLALRRDGRIEEAEKINAGLRPVPMLDAAYLASIGKAPDVALQTFQQIDAAGKLPARSLQDAGFAAVNAHDNPAANGYFRRTVDAAAAGDLSLTPQQLFETRRAVAETGRGQFGGYVSQSMVSQDIRQPNAFPDPGTHLASQTVSQVGAEGYWRPPALDHGSNYVDVYARVTGYLLNTNADSATGAESLQGTVGIRWKPLQDYFLILALERNIKLNGFGDSSWLARVAFSDSFGGDMRMDVPSWNYGQVYAEAGHFDYSHSFYFVSETQLGRSFRLPDDWSKNTVVTPHAVLAADYVQSFAPLNGTGSASTLTALSKPNAIGAGVGVNWRRWLREDYYNAPRSYIDLSLQYRWRIAGDTRAGGLFFRTVYNY